MPTAIGLSRVYKTPAAFNEKVKLINDFRDLMANGLAFNSSTVRDGLPNIYSGLVIVFFIFVYISHFYRFYFVKVAFLLYFLCNKEL